MNVQFDFTNFLSYLTDVFITSIQGIVNFDEDTGSPQDSKRALRTRNPWNVADVSAFLYYNCPECENYKTRSENGFIAHAISKHDRVSIT